MTKSYFTIAELCASNTAQKYKINNSPSDEIKSHLEELISFLNPIREALGYPINITSGYRCPELNKTVGGVAKSAHTAGYAVDMQCNKISIKELYMFIAGFLKGNNLKWDQLIFERSGSTQWVHLSYKGVGGEQRCQIKELVV